jgi:nickel-dependent lactate racemase
MISAKPLADPADAIEHALKNSIGSPGLSSIIKSKLEEKPTCKAVVVISDHTRPVPYRGEYGILWPVVRKLLEGGVRRENILVLVATGTHHAVSVRQLGEMLDPRIQELGIETLNHDCHAMEGLVYLGKASFGSEVYVNRRYMEADIRILTGLVESHFIAGVSGGRKAVCPGLVGESTIYRFHSAEMLASKNARDMNLEGNPCHEEALEVAERAGVDYIVNVTLDKDYRLTGVFAGDLRKAHLAAFEFLKQYVAIPVQRKYDVIVVHGGHVGINHYQAVKAGLAALPAIKHNGTIILPVADTDDESIGTQRYKSILHLLKLVGPERFSRLIFSPDWCFILEQWEVQAWGRVLYEVPAEKLVYYGPHVSATEYEILPAVDGNCYLPVAKRYKADLTNISDFIQNAVAAVVASQRSQMASDPSVAVLVDGPYGILMEESSLESPAERSPPIFR